MSISLLASDAPAVPGVGFSQRPYAALRRVCRLLTDRPQPLASIRRQAMMDSGPAKAILGKLIAAGLAEQIEGAGYVRCGPRLTVLSEGQVVPKVGGRIVACLTEPRRARDIARIIDRPGSVTTGHLRHLLKRGLVVRLDWGLYALAAHHPGIDSAEPVRRVKAAAARRSAEAGAAVLVPVAGMAGAAPQRGAGAPAACGS
jgi:DNA-binding IclR family transcriptional regulator